MLTIFSMPKPFTGLIGVIQRNALISWSLLDPKPEIILLGQEEGTAAICQEFGFRHIPEVACNQYGTPLVSDIFEKAIAAATHDVLGYVNADIILMGDFCSAIVRAKAWRKQFLMTGERWDHDVFRPLNFDNNHWQEGLMADVKLRGKPHGFSGVDYFVFSKGVFGQIPPFAVGRPYYDCWFFWHVRSRKVPIIDTSRIVFCVHQNHERTYASIGKSPVNGEDRWRKSVEAIKNFELAGGSYEKILNVLHSTHVMYSRIIMPAWGMKYVLAKCFDKASLWDQWLQGVDVPRESKGMEYMVAKDEKVTIFSVPGSFFDPDIAKRQRSAIKSWLSLMPRPEVILFGNEPGVAECCAEFNLRHVPHVPTNEDGAPYLHAVFKIAQKISSHEFLCYMNTDIIVTDLFMVAIQRAMQWHSRFLLLGQKLDIDLSDEIDITSLNWADDLARLGQEKGKVHPPWGSDFFVFPKKIPIDMPSFVAGSPFWDNWMIYYFRKMRIPVVDISPSYLVFHPEHDRLQEDVQLARVAQMGAEYNRALVDHIDEVKFKLSEATHLMGPDSVYLNRRGRDSVRSKKIFKILHPIGYQITEWLFQYAKWEVVARDLVSFVLIFWILFICWAAMGSGDVPALLAMILALLLVMQGRVYHRTGNDNKDIREQMGRLEKSMKGLIKNVSEISQGQEDGKLICQQIDQLSRNMEGVARDVSSIEQLKKDGEEARQQIGQLYNNVEGVANKVSGIEQLKKDGEWIRQQMGRSEKDMEGLLKKILMKQHTKDVDVRSFSDLFTKQVQLVISRKGRMSLLEVLPELLEDDSVPTECSAYRQLKARPLVAEVNYLAFPWARFIQWTRFVYAKNRNNLPGLMLPKFKVTGGFTVCQSIHYKEIIPVLQEMGVDTLFTPHAESESIDGIKIVPFPHYAVNGPFPATVKDIWYSFVGSTSGVELREEMFLMTHPDNAVMKKREDWHFTLDMFEPSSLKSPGSYVKAASEEHAQEYRDILARSRYSLCPKGTGPSTIRFWESLCAGAVPVLISDKMRLPLVTGVNWDECLIRLRESDLLSMRNVLAAIPSEKEELMRCNGLKAYQLCSGDNLVRSIRDYYEKDSRGSDV